MEILKITFRNQWSDAVFFSGNKDSTQTPRPPPPPPSPNLWEGLFILIWINACILFQKASFFLADKQRWNNVGWTSMQKYDVVSKGSYDIAVVSTLCPLPRGHMTFKKCRIMTLHWRWCGVVSALRARTMTCFRYKNNDATLHTSCQCIDILEKKLRPEAPVCLPLYGTANARSYAKYHQVDLTDLVNFNHSALCFLSELLQLYS